MRLLSGVLGVTLTSVVALASANAADIYRAPDVVGGYKDVPPVYVPLGWTGFYIGADIGGIGVNDSVFDRDGFGGVVPVRRSFNGGTDFFGGVDLGYNWQSGAFVFGIESDIGGFSINGNRTNAFGGTVNINASGGFYADITGRLGYLVAPNVLLYGKGGWAYADTNWSPRSNLVGNYVYNNTNGASGWTAGGGIEYKLNPNWSLKVEYLYFDLGANTETITNVGTNIRYRFDNDLTANSVKFGVNYSFTPAYEPLK